ncbi:hypothetical protein SAMN04490181_4462 [Pseudomonas brenneri]|uniref:Uncharacterized protein n=1 Tax=Pseudomonas brenneri TaxID=129817 RepID=A0ABY0WKZ7_9PSED|nr:hypothetical protein SAMN04490181_4462 [Pseudomonas brenneri]
MKNGHADWVGCPFLLGQCLPKGQRIEIFRVMHARSARPHYQVWPGIQNRFLPPDLMIFSTSSVNDFAISVLSSADG